MRYLEVDLHYSHFIALQVVTHRVKGFRVLEVDNVRGFALVGCA